MSTTSDRIGAQANELSEDLKEMGATVKDALQGKLRDARQNATDYYEQGRDNAHGALCNVEQYVRDRPVRSVLIGAGIGLLFGRFWMRR